MSSCYRRQSSGARSPLLLTPSLYVTSPMLLWRLNEKMSTINSVNHELFCKFKKILISEHFAIMLSLCFQISPILTQHHNTTRKLDEFAVPFRHRPSSSSHWFGMDSICQCLSHPLHLFPLIPLLRGFPRIEWNASSRAVKTTPSLKTNSLFLVLILYPCWPHPLPQTLSWLRNHSGYPDSLCLFSWMTSASATTPPLAPPWALLWCLCCGRYKRLSQHSFLPTVPPIAREGSLTSFAPFLAPACPTADVHRMPCRPCHPGHITIITLVLLVPTLI